MSKTIFSFRRFLATMIKVKSKELRPTLGLLLMLFLMSAGSASGQELTARDLGNSLTLISGAGSNILVKKSANGEVLVIDGGLAVNARQTLATISDITDSGAVTMLVNTHWHPEQTGLNQLLGSQGATIFAHENTRQWLTSSIHRPWENTQFAPLPDSAQPTETFFHYGSLDHGGTDVQYGYLRQAHTDGDLYIYFPNENVLHGGGVLSNETWPLMDWWTGGWIGGLVDGLEVLLEIANDDTVIVPANGPLMNKADLQAMRDMYDTIFQRISSGFRAANSVEVTLSEVPTAEYNERWGNPEQFIRRAHESLIPHYTPDA